MKDVGSGPMRAPERSSGLDARTGPGRLPPMNIVANGRELPVESPCTVEEFLVRQGLLPRSVVVEHNGDAVAPSEFASRDLSAGDRLEIVKIVAGG